MIGTDVLPFGLLGNRTVHLCIDMQNVFAEEASPWHAPWMKRVLPVVATIAGRHPERTIFTRFMPPGEPEEMPGAWRRFYERWRELTRSRADPRLVELIPELARFAPPATVLDKMGYSPFHGTELAAYLRTRNVDSVVITGTETDMCVAAAVLDAVDIGLGVVVAEDGICSSSDTTHDALMMLYRERFGQQIELPGQRRSWRVGFEGGAGNGDSANRRLPRGQPSTPACRPGRSDQAVNEVPQLGQRECVSVTCSSRPSCQERSSLSGFCGGLQDDLRKPRDRLDRRRIPRAPGRQLGGATAAT